MRHTTLLAFQKIAETKSLSAAARELYISAPALKQSMDSLEKEVGFPVLNRSHKGVTLTREGEMFYEGSKKILSDYEELLKKCRNSYRNTQRILKAGVAMPSVLADICSDFSHAFPDIKLQYLTLEGKKPKEMLQILKSGTVDLLEFIRMDVYSDAAICFQTVFHDRLCALVNDHNPLVQETCIDLGKISGQTVYLADADYSSLSALNDFLKENNSDIPLKTAAYTDTEIINCCTADSIYLTESFYARKFVTLRQIPLKQDFCFDVGAAYKADCSPMVHMFIEFLAGYASDSR